MGAAFRSVNLRLPHISETIRASKLKYCTHLDGSLSLFGYEN